MPSLNEGWFWDDGEFKFSWERRRIDMESDITDEQRTMKEITKSMC